MKYFFTNGIKTWITFFLFSLILLFDRTDAVPIGKKLTEIIFESIAVRYDEILSKGLNGLLQTLAK